MYLPEKFAVHDDSELLGAIERWNFGLLVSSSQDQLHTSLLPFIVDREKRVLQAHMARTNNHWQALETNPEALVSFQGPHCYISPSLYVTPNLVPTWNYLTIEVRGQVRLIEDPAEAHRQMQTLVLEHEQHRGNPWTMDAVKPSLLKTMQQQIVCFELTLDEIIGKAKMSQNRPAVDRNNVIRLLSESDDAQEREVAQLMHQYNTD